MMKKFKFRLDPIVRFRRYRERIALIDLAATKRKLIETTNKIQQIEQDRKTTAIEVDQRQAEGMAVRDFCTYAAYMERLYREEESGNEYLVEIENKIKEKQKVAEVERTRKKTLVRLKEIEYAEYSKKLELSEQKAADELLGLRRRPEKFVIV